MNESSLTLPKPRSEPPGLDLSSALIPVFVGAAALGLLTANPLLTAACFLTLPVLFKLLWRTGETPILLFAAGFQWLQVSAKVFQADLRGLPVGVISDTDTVSQTILLSLLGLIVLAIGMRVGIRKLQPATAAEVDEEAWRFSPQQLFLLYLAGTTAATVILTLAWVLPGASQIATGAAAIKWVPFCLLGYVVLQQKKNYGYLGIALAIEFVAGIGFFSGFKTVIFIALIVVFTIYTRFRFKTVVLGFVMLAALMIMALGWTSVKGPYRAFLNQGTGMQVTLVSQSAQIAVLLRLVGQLTPQDLLVAFDPLFSRLAYVDYFALSMDNVPAVRPHEGGRLWGISIGHILQPRVLFPDKPPLIDDSELTMRYTGLRLATGSEGTSISIGYMGESYIDFGPVGMFGPIFLLGFFWGFMYYFFRSRSKTVLTGYAFATALLINAYQLEIASGKLLGGITSKFIVLALLLKFAEPTIVAWLSKESDRRKARAALKTAAG